MRAMRKHNPAEQEDGLHSVLRHVADHVDELMAELDSHSHGHGLTCWLLELLGEARSAKALPTLTAFLSSSDESVRWWAERGLVKLNTKAARRELWKARANRGPE